MLCSICADGRREGSGALPGTFGAVLPGARAGAGMRPPQLNRAAGGAGPKYNKADLMDVFFKMKNEVCNLPKQQLPSTECIENQHHVHVFGDAGRG